MNEDEGESEEEDIERVKEEDMSEEEEVLKE